jgi:glutaminyl-peptide cyclotransferase
MIELPAVTLHVPRCCRRDGVARRPARGAARARPWMPIRSSAAIRTIPAAFTQGLVYLDGVLYESTGLNGQSSLRRVRLETGEVLQIHRLEIATSPKAWPSGRTGSSSSPTDGDRLRLRARDVQARAHVHLQGEGWGLTHDGKRLIMSDGSSFLRFLDPETFKETGRVRVTDGGVPVEQLNELEYIKGEVFANVWGSHRIARIDRRPAA